MRRLFIKIIAWTIALLLIIGIFILTATWFAVGFLAVVLTPAYIIAFLLGADTSSYDFAMLLASLLIYIGSVKLLTSMTLEW